MKGVTQELKDITDSVSLTVGKVDDSDYDSQARAYKNASTNSDEGLGTPTAILPPGAGLNQTTSQAETIGGVIVSKAYEMRQNSEEYNRLGGGAMANASSEQRALIHRNDDLAAEISDLIGGTLTRGNDGVWRLPDGTMLYSILPAAPTKLDLLRIGQKYGKFHSGGIVGTATPKQDEVYALLQNGEAVFTKEQQSSLMRILEFSKALAGKFDSLAISGANILTGHLKEMVRNDMNPAYAGAGNVSYDINVPVQIFPAQKMDEAEIKSLTSKISDFTIKTLNNDMSRRGIRGGAKIF